MARIPTSLQAANRRLKRAGRTVPVTSGDSYRYSTNDLYGAASKPKNREAKPRLDRDFHEAITPEGRRLLLTMSRGLRANFSVVDGMVTQIASMATLGMAPKFMGQDRAWGREAERLLMDWDEVACVGGNQYCGVMFDELMASAMIADNDIGVLLTTAKTTGIEASGYPQIQVVRSHRIGSRYHHNWIYNDRQVIDGVTVNDVRRPVSYLLNADNDHELVEVPANRFVLAYMPQEFDAVRGVSKLGSSARDWDDVRASRQFELTAQRACAAHTIVETNEDGEPADEASRIITAETRDDDGALTAPQVVALDEGSYRYLKANTGSTLTAFDYNRPGPNSQAFQENVLVCAALSLGWSYWYAVNPARLTGRGAYIIVDQMNRTLARIRRAYALVKRRIYKYAVRQFIEIGALPDNGEWWMWGVHYPGDISADRKHDFEVEEGRYSMGTQTLQRIHGANGTEWESEVRQWIHERRRLQEIAEEEQYEGPMPGDTILSKATAAAQPMDAQAQPEDAPDEEEDGDEA